jgi:hypothetical protein
MLKLPDFNLPLSGPVMMYLVLDVQSTSHTDKCSQLNAWVNARNHIEAMEILHEELSLEGWALTNIIESTTTDESDYFPPCTSLDAYKEAERGLLALRFL